MKVLFVYRENESPAIEQLSAVLKKNTHATELVVDLFAFKGGPKLSFLGRRFDFLKLISEKIQEMDPDLIAFSVVTDDYLWACERAEFIKEKFPRIPIVFGGIHPTAVPEKVLENGFVDFVILGEGEYALVELLENISKPDQWPSIRNLCYRSNEKVVINETRPLIENLDELPPADKELFYRQMPYLAQRYLVLTSRGCPNSCTYCCNSLLKKLNQGKGKHVRRRSSESVIQELFMARQRYKIKEVLFFDDHFLFDAKWLSEFLEEYEEKIKLPFRCLSIARYIDRQTRALLEKNGYCTFLQIGVQTASEKLRQEICHRHDDNENIVQVVKSLKKIKIAVALDHIFGLPNETVEDHIDSARFYVSLKPDLIDTFWLNYYPGTEIVGIAQKLGLLTDQEIEEIEHGKFQRRYEVVEAGHIANLEILKKLRNFFNLIPLLPVKMSNFIIQRRIYCYFPSNQAFGNFLQRIILIFSIRTYRLKALEKLNKYLYAFSKKYL